MAPSDSYQAPVPDVKNPDSEIILATMDLEDVSNKKKDYVNNWLNLNVTVQDEIWRGKKLREEKPAPIGREEECSVPEINIYGPFVKKRRGRKGYFKSQNKTSPCSSTSRSSRKRANSPASICVAANRFPKIKQKQAKKSKRCPMRIAELAVPTKRQCIETWRQKYNVLPAIMVERLKQQVMDQTPIVKIPEAIYCFQRGKFVSSKKSSSRWLSNKMKGYETLQPNHQIATRILCIVFAHKITNILSNPMNLNLNPELEELSRIVASDIAKIMPQHQCTFKKNPQYEAIHIDVSKKIAVWIAGIVEDTAVKLLEEELRVKKKAEAQIDTMLQFSDEFYTIFESIYQRKKKVVSEKMLQSEDLEEEEGPVLDFIDDVVDNVMNLCEPQIEAEPDSSDYSRDELLEEESGQLITPIESSDTKMSKLEETTGNIKHLSDLDHFKNEIGNIIDNIPKESGNDTSEEISSKTEMEHDIVDDGGTNEEVSTMAEIKRDSSDLNITDASSEASMHQDINDGNYEKVLLEAEMVHNNRDEDISPGSEMEQDINDANINQIADNLSNVENNDDTLEKTDSNVSERFEIFTDDSGDDMNNKKVMFSKTDSVNPETYAAQIIASTMERSEYDERLQEQWHPQNNKSIIFAKPNEKLLSYADESWPYDLSDKTLLKVSESANKSVSSLGKITEKDEKQTSTPDAENNDADKATQVNDLMKELDTMYPTAKHDRANQSMKPPIKASAKTSTLEPKTRASQDNTKLIKESDIGKTTTVKPNVESFKISEYHETDTGQSDLIRKGRTADIREDEATHSPTRQSQMGFGWKVHPKTAPSWVTSWGQGRGEPSEDSSIKMQKKPIKVTEYELRKWCKQLEKAFQNLEMWSNWISSTCKESLLMLRQKEFACPALAHKGAINRIRHKKDVRKDALLWTKLYHRTESNFKSLKRKYDNIEYSSNESSSMINETAYDMIRDFEKQSMDLHKMIVAAEYCALCKCNKIKTKLNFKKEYNTK